MIANLSKIRSFRPSARYLLHGDRERPQAGERPDVGQRRDVGKDSGGRDLSGNRGLDGDRDLHQDQGSPTGNAPTRVLWTRSYGGASGDVMTAAAEMADLGRYNPRVQVPGYHLVLSFDPEDEVGRAEMLYVRDQIHRALEFPDLLSVVVAHGDAYYPHWHELICRVDYWSGKAVDPSFPYVTIERRLRELEREMGLRETPGRHGRLPGQSGPDGRFRPQFDTRWLGAEDRAAARRALRAARSWAELEERLAGRDLVPRLGRKNLVLARGEDRIRAGSLARGTSLMKMEQRMGETFAAYVRSKGAEAMIPVGMDVPRPGEASAERGESPQTGLPRTRHTDQTQGAPELRQADQETDVRGGIGSRAGPLPEGSAAGTPPNAGSDPPLRPDLQALMEDMQAYDLGEELLDVEAEIRRLQDYTLPVLKDQQKAIRRRYAEVTDLFDRAYVDGDLARSRFDQAAVLEGVDPATRRLEDAPESFGELRGGALFQFQERRERREALAVLPNTAGSHHEALHTVERTFVPPPGSASPGDALFGGEPAARDPSQIDSSRRADPGRAPADDRLGARLADLYENPAAARQRFEAVCRRLGTEPAAVGLNRHPEGFGRLRREVEASPRLRAESAYATAIAAVERAGGAEGPGRGTLLDEAFDEEAERLRALQEDRADLQARLRARAEASPHLRGLHPADLERWLEARLRALSAADRGRVVRALEDRLRRQAAMPGRAERVARHRPHPHQRMGTGLRSAAYSLALHASSRALGRGADEIMGRDTFSE